MKKSDNKTIPKYKDIRVWKEIQIQLILESWGKETFNFSMT